MDVKPTLDLATPFDQLVDAAEQVLASDPEIFQHGGELVSVKGSMRALSQAELIYFLSRAANWQRNGIPTHPPASIARCLFNRSHYENIRKLRCCVPFPPISADGNVKYDFGWDHRTQVFYTGNKLSLIERPTKQDAIKASQEILDLVCDFPFANGSHRAAWLAALLSPLSRFCHDGNIPIIVVQANSPRAGKTRLVKIISRILTGGECPIITHAKSEDEERKRILAYLRAGRHLIHIDNVVGRWGGAQINALCTSRQFEDRILGSQKILQVENDATWFVTGNNISLAPDTSERCQNIRLECAEEKPQLRNSFKYPDLFTEVDKRREKLLSAAITILRAYLLAGCPDQNLPAWGSFEEWSRIIRGAVVWCGYQDPANTREELETESDEERPLHQAVVQGWLELQEALEVDTLTCRGVCRALEMNISAGRTLKEAMQEWCRRKHFGAHTLGRYLREIKNRNLGGLILRCLPDEKNGHHWYVENTHDQGRGIGGTRGTDLGTSSSFDAE